MRGNDTADTAGGLCSSGRSRGDGSVEAGGPAGLGELATRQREKYQVSVQSVKSPSNPAELDMLQPRQRHWMMPRGRLGSTCATHKSSPGRSGRLGAARPAVGGRRRPHRPPDREPPGGAGLARHAARPGRRVGDALAGAGLRPRRRAGGDRLRHPEAGGAPDDAGWCRPRLAGQAAGPDGARPRGAPHHPGRARSCSNGSCTASGRAIRRSCSRRVTPRWRPRRP